MQERVSTLDWFSGVSLVPSKFTSTLLTVPSPSTVLNAVWRIGKVYAESKQGDLKVWSKTLACFLLEVCVLVLKTTGKRIGSLEVQVAHPDTRPL